MTLSDKIKEYTKGLSLQGLLRTREVSQPADHPCIRFDSNDYLSLTQDKRIVQAYQQGYKYFPSGSGASMILSGYHKNHQAVEEAFAQLLAVDQCILFSSGYAANLAVTALLGKINTRCLIDKNIHASIYDGLALSQVQYKRFLHNNITDLSRQLTSLCEESLVMTEGIFSMSGQMAPLAGIAQLTARYNAELIVDEAHSFGVLGQEGRGAINYHGLSQNEIPLRVIPLGKACAAQGAIVAGKQEWIGALLQAGRSIIYSTAVSPALSYGLLKTLDVVVTSEERRIHLQQLIQLFRESVRDSHLNWGDSHTAIQQLKLGCPYLTIHYANELKKNGFYCSAIRSPTVTKSATGLRVILNSAHQPEDILRLFNMLHRIYDNTHQ